MPVEEMTRVPVGELSLWERNPRTIQPARFAALKRSMSEDPDMMEARPLIALPDGRVIAGNMRLRAAQELGWPDVPVVYSDMDETKAATWALRDNVGYGEWADEGLAALLRELESQEVDLELTGLQKDDIKTLFDTIVDPDAPVVEDDRGSDLQLADVSVGDPKHEVSRGEVWKLGPHVLVVDDLYEGWPRWIHLLEEGMLLVPYPTPTLPLTERAARSAVLMVQPDSWLAGHVIDKWVAVKGAETASKVSP